RAFSAAGTDHFYTTSNVEITRAAGYKSEGNVGRIYPNQVQQTTPLYRLYSAWGINHFYTTNAQERDTYVAYYGYVSEGVAGYVFPWQICNSVPLYRLYNQVVQDHLFTTNYNEIQAVQRLGFAYQGIAGYVVA
ncbi:hypothetical protein BDN71DRAFT_1397494, partial [Pleurotus eryngii]